MPEVSVNQLPYLDYIPMGLIYLDLDRRIRMMNQFALDKLNRRKEDVLNKLWEQEFPSIKLAKEGTGLHSKTIRFAYGQEQFIIQKEAPFSENGIMQGHIYIFQHANDLEEITQGLHSYEELNADLKAIFDISYDVIYVSDGEGITQRVSSACERLWGFKESELVGKSVYELEKEGVFNPSASRLVLEKQDRISCIQTTKTGRRLMVVGTPIKDKEGKIIRIVNASRDITEISELQSELELMKQLTEGYKQELKDLRIQNEVETKLVYRSEKTKKILGLIQRVADVDTPVLLTGEPGV